MPCGFGVYLSVIFRLSQTSEVSETSEVLSPAPSLGWLGDLFSKPKVNQRFRGYPLLACLSSHLGQQILRYGAIGRP
jgi:hypothetical protein